MADTLKPMYTGQPGTGDTLLYTAPAAGAAITSIHMVNTSGTDRTITLGVNSGGALAAANYWWNGTLKANGGTYDWTGSHPLGNAATIRALQENATAITVHIGGVEQ